MYTETGTHGSNREVRGIISPIDSTTSASEFADWAGAVSGKLGQRTSNGFEIVDAGIQIFEKKANIVKPDVAAAEAGAS